MEQGNNRDWCILRTGSGSTLTLADELRVRDYEVWTPIETVKRRAPRSKAEREVTRPLTPGIIFADHARLHDLLAFSRSPDQLFRRWNPITERMEIKGCPYFSVFRYNGKYPRIIDRHLDPLRQAERRERPRSHGPLLNVGDQVRHPSSMLGGLVGVVLDTRRRNAVVRFGTLDIEIEMADLLPLAKAA